MRFSFPLLASVRCLLIVVAGAAVPSLRAQRPNVLPPSSATLTTEAAGTVTPPAPSVLFVGNSFMYGWGSPVRYYRAHTVTDLNREGIGGVPALFKAFALQAGLDFAVSLETASGKGLDFHLEKKADLIVRPWDHAVLLSYSTLNQNKPGDPDLLIRSARKLSELLVRENPRVDIRLIATWSRADQVYPPAGHWHGKPVEQMARDVRAAYDLAAAASPFIRGIVPVGEAWNRAFATGVADPNPYDGIAAGQINLWAYDHYHASTFGYYLEALMVFGSLTGLDPRSLGPNERTAHELGLSPAQAGTLQDLAFAELTAPSRSAELRPFTPKALPR